MVMSSFSSEFNREFILLLIGLEKFYLELYSFQLLLMKANKPWWYGLIFFGILFLFTFLIYIFKI